MLSSEAFDDHELRGLSKPEQRRLVMAVDVGQLRLDDVGEQAVPERVLDPDPEVLREHGYTEDDLPPAWGRLDDTSGGDHHGK